MIPKERPDAQALFILSPTTVATIQGTQRVTKQSTEV